METDNKCRILVIDDEKTDLLILHRILSKDYVIFTAKSGCCGLKRAGAERPDLILLDIIMPDISGFDVLKILKADPDLKDIPIIIITGLDNEADEEKGLLLGAVDYIFKPFNNAIVRARIKIHIQIVQYIRRIEHLTHADPLTDIPNRRCFDERIVLEWKRAARDKMPISLMMIDVDKFKNYNDTYGHPQGDVLLQAISKIFAATARRPLDVAARLGGEEFCILLPDTPAETAYAMAEKLRAQVEMARISLSNSGSFTSVTISIGVASLVPQEQSRMEDFIALADANLYAAKKAGRNRVTGP
ncbi:MAG: diguanylate cyclase [Treponema sp.]|jgi:diguanylate cyclase (GGDEF)-like protein|nr:diguanylate cyclase [Treponema sp.]